MSLSPNSAILASPLDGTPTSGQMLPAMPGGIEMPGDKPALDALDNIKAAFPVIDKYRKRARECSDFNAGHHFGDEDKQEMDMAGRPTAAFNEAQKYIRFVHGLIVGAEMEIQFLPRDIQDDNQAGAGDLATDLYEYILQQCMGSEERGAAVWDLLETGMGFTDTEYGRVKDPEGMISISRIPWDEMLWDTRARRACLEDARWIARERTMSKGECMERWGRDNEDKIILSLGMGTGDRKPQESFLYNEKSARPKDSTEWPSVSPNKIRVIEYQWYDEDTIVEFADPFENKVDSLPYEAFMEFRSRYKKALPGLRAAMVQPGQRNFPNDIEYNETVVRNYKRIVVIGQWVVEGPYPLPGKRFTFNAMTGQWDNKEGIWYGFMRLLMDPQRYMTKFVNQVMEIITRSPKGGLLAEADAFLDPKRAELEYGLSGSIQWMSPGAIAANKVQPKQAPSLPQGSAEMIQVCAAMLRETTGLDPSGVMGASGGDVPMVTMKQRQAASFVLLTTEFNSVKRYQKNEAYTVLDFMPLIADERIIRIGHPWDNKFVRVVKDPFQFKYDVVLGEGTKDPARREQYMADLKTFMPILSKEGLTVEALLNYTNLPAKLIHVLKEQMAQKKQQQMEMSKMGIQIGGRGKPVSIKEVQARAAKIEADAELSKAKAMKISEDIHSNRGKMLLDAYLKKLEMQQQAEQGQMQNQMSHAQLGKDMIGMASKEQQAMMQMQAQQAQRQGDDQ
jgi:hypothetical protein